MQNRIRATASRWLGRSHSWAAEGFFENGVLVKPKWVTQGVRIMAVVPPAAAQVGRGMRVGRWFRRHARPAPGRGSRRLSVVEEWVAELAAPGDAHAGRG